MAQEIHFWLHSSPGCWIPFLDKSSCWEVIILETYLPNCHSTCWKDFRTLKSYDKIFYYKQSSSKSVIWEVLPKIPALSCNSVTPDSVSSSPNHATCLFEETLYIALQRVQLWFCLDEINHWAFHCDVDVEFAENLKWQLFLPGNDKLCFGILQRLLL